MTGDRLADFGARLLERLDGEAEASFAREPAAYEQIADELAGAINLGQMVPGSRLPPERELATQFQVSRMTLRQALTVLERRGLLVRRPGLGSFVSEPRLTQNAGILHGFFDEMLRQGIVPLTRTLSKEEVEATLGVAEGLDLNPHDHVYRVIRLRSAGRTPVVRETSFFPVGVVPGIIELDLDHTSLYGLMDQKYAAGPVRAVQILQPVAATKHEAAALEVAEGSPLMLVERRSWDRQGRRVEYAKDVYRGDRIQFVSELHL